MIGKFRAYISVSVVLKGLSLFDYILHEINIFKPVLHTILILLELDVISDH